MATWNYIQKKRTPSIIAIDHEATVLEAKKTIESLNVPQMPVTDEGVMIGMVTENDISNSLIENPSIKSQPVKNITNFLSSFVNLNTSKDQDEQQEPIQPLTAPMTTTTTSLPGLEDIQIIKSYPRYTKENSQYSTIENNSIKSRLI